MKKNNKGFSLVELIIVIAIMAVLIAVLAPQFLRYVEKSRAQKDFSAVSEVLNASKIALADEAIAKEVAGKTGKKATVTITNAGVVSCDSALLQAELNAATGLALKFTSSAFSGNTKSITIVIVGDPSAGFTFTVNDMPSGYVF